MGKMMDWLEFASDHKLKKRFDNGWELDGTCWRWTKCKNPLGYGQINVKYKLISAHIVGYWLHKGRIPADLFLDHLCRNPWCVNPDHLEPVTHAENNRRSIPATRDHCKHGHPYSENLMHRPSETIRRCRICEQNKTKRGAEKRKQKMLQWEKELANGQG